jgi:hypothetical protein
MSYNTKSYHYKILILTFKFPYRDADKAPVDPTAVRASWFRGGPQSMEF